MNFKLLIIALILILFGAATYIVILNRSSDKLVSNYFSILLIGFIGLLINSLFTLNDKVEQRDFVGYLFIKEKPLSIWLLNAPLKRNSPSMLYTNEAIKLAYSENKELFNDSTILSQKTYLDLFERTIIELMINKNRTNWYVKEFKYKVPSNTNVMSSYPRDRGVKSHDLDWEVFKSTFNENNFIKYGFLKNESSQGILGNLNVPENTSIKCKKEGVGIIKRKIILENEFYKYEVEFWLSGTHGINDSNLDILKVYNIEFKELLKFKFLVFNVETKITLKKLRSGHPEMEKYKYWLNDLDTFIFSSINVEEFWNIIELNK
jgi:hypothetical protein